MSRFELLKLVPLGIALAASLAQANDLARVTDRAEVPVFARDRTEIINVQAARLDR
jgi:hypothetical protein